MSEDSVHAVAHLFKLWTIFFLQRAIECELKNCLKSTLKLK